jgi:hypothetical protein
MTPHNPGFSVWHVFYPDGESVRRAYGERFRKDGFTNPYIRHNPGPELILYEDYIRLGLPELRRSMDEFPCVMPNWDNTARSGRKGWVFVGSTPELFGQHLREAIASVADKPAEKRLVFVKSWNEWAEGNYLEPDVKFGKGYLEACRAEVFRNQP